MFEVIRVEKTKNYTVICNHHLQNKNLSLKAKGLMTIMLALPNEAWDLSISGLASMSKEGESAIRSSLKELEKEGYFKRQRIYENGQIARWEYTLYEMPHLDVENLHQENLKVENLKVENLREINTKENEILKKTNTKRFIPPTIEEVAGYCKERNNGIDAEQFVDFYEAKGWKVGNNKMKDWKAAVRTWERRERKPKQETTFNSFEQRKYDYTALEKQLFN